MLMEMGLEGREGKVGPPLQVKEDVGGRDGKVQSSVVARRVDSDNDDEIRRSHNDSTDTMTTMYDSA